MNARYTRRQTIVAGASLAAGTALAGCVGIEDEPSETSDDDADDGTAPEDDGETDGSRTGPLEIRNVQVTATEPTGYGEYEPISDRVVSGSDPIWFYLEPVGVTTVPTDDGKERVELSGELTISTDDTTVFSDSIPFEYELPPDQVDQLYLTVKFTPGSTGEPGRYTADIVLRDQQREDGGEARATTGFRIEDDEPKRPDTDLAVDTFEFAQERPTGYGEYTPVDELVFDPDETIWLYIEPADVALERRGDEDWFELDVIITLYSPDGDDHRPIRSTETGPVPAGQTLEDLYFAIDLSARDPAVGEYTVELEMIDRVARSEATATRTFEIYDRDLELLEIYREFLEEEGIEIERLTIRNETISLNYHSAYEYDTEDFGGEIGTIAGSYAVFVDEGFSAAQLRASGTDTADQEFAFRVESDVAQAWIDDEISRDEYVDHVVESIRRRD
ncbi:hypothetical protein [Natronosalvus amylolyticus]|uniref:hypothetical protein n=1 Tax=Natronosalvus amylolyticus TaxID=2961994 RepID=UPI0020C969E1|nr:hypothetical protein [Natronosalvus amylolyticus]